MPSLSDPGKAFGDDAQTPFQIGFTVLGVKPFFFNAPNVDEYERVEALPKGRARKEAAKDMEPKVWRDPKGNLAMPGHEFVKAMAEAARGQKDPTNSGHKSMRPVVFKALSASQEFVPFLSMNGKVQAVKKWDEVDARLVRRATSMAPCRRPILHAGWMTDVEIQVVWPEVFAPADIAVLMGRAGVFGVGDGQKIGMGRFVVTETREPKELSWT